MLAAVPKSVFAIMPSSCLGNMALTCGPGGFSALTGGDVQAGYTCTQVSRSPERGVENIQSQTTCVLSAPRDSTIDRPYFTTDYC